MTYQTLLLVEASNIQDYIFGSDQLIHNSGAAELVRQATEDWVKDLTAPTQRVCTGGGNAMLLFDTEGSAEAFARRLTRRALEEAPGLQLVVARQTFESGHLRETHQALRIKLARRKASRQPSTPLLGQGVTAACIYTGAPAVEVREGRLISAEVRAKLAQTEAGKARLIGGLPQVEKAGYDFADDFNDFGMKGEFSYLAVIHANSNRMDERIEALSGKSDADYIHALSAFFQSVEAAAAKALNSTIDRLLWAADPHVQKSVGTVPVLNHRLPFRPIVFGGDNVTFVCEGHLGLAVAAHYLRVFSEQKLSDGELAHARAGVAIVKPHYPFSQAYELAKDLADSAKACITEGQAPMTALDWHFAVSGLVLSLEQVRAQDYTVPDGSLLMRPLRINPATGDWRSWETFARIMRAFQAEDGPWAGQRNKIKALRQALRAGRQAVSHFLSAYPGLRCLPEIAGLPTMGDQGWQGKRCGYFDAIEALDFYIPLEAEKPQ